MSKSESDYKKRLVLRRGGGRGKAEGKGGRKSGKRDSTQLRPEIHNTVIKYIHHT